MSQHIEPEETPTTQRAAFDIRIHIEGTTSLEIYALATKFVREAQLTAPTGIEVRYHQLRDGRKSRDFEPTLWPIKGNHK